MFRRFARLAGNLYAAVIQLRNAITHAVLRELVTIRSERIRLDDLGPCLEICLVNAEHGFSMRRVQLFHIALLPHRFVKQ